MFKTSFTIHHQKTRKGYKKARKRYENLYEEGKKRVTILLRKI